MYILNVEVDFNPSVFESFSEGFNSLYSTVLEKLQKTYTFFADPEFTEKFKNVFIQDTTNSYANATCVELSRELYGVDKIPPLDTNAQQILYDLRDIFNKGVHKKPFTYSFGNISFISVESDFDNF